MTKTKNKKEAGEKEVNKKVEDKQENQDQKEQKELNFENQLSQEELLKKAAEAEEYKNHLQRLQAEFDNYRKRTSESALSYRNDGICDVMLELIPAIDNMERGIEAVKDKSAKDGMQIILKQLKDILKKFDVCEIKALGEQFNPDIHHAIAQEEKEDGNSQTVSEVFLKGYERKNKVLRAAMVKVIK